MIPTAVARESQGECPTCQYEKRASPNRQCTGGPSYNKSFILSSFTNCMSSAWNTSRHSPYSSHRAHMGHRRVNKHCDCQVLGQCYVRRPCFHFSQCSSYHSTHGSWRRGAPALGWGGNYWPDLMNAPIPVALSWPALSVPLMDSTAVRPPPRPFDSL